MASVKKCQYCFADLEKDEVGLSKKLFEPETKRNKFTCLNCMAAILETTEDELREKIVEFKAAGCKLFG